MWYHTCKAKITYQLSKLFWWISVQDSNSVVGDTGATHADLREAVQSFVCVLIGIHSKAWKQLYISERGKPIRIMTLPSVYAYPASHICCNPQESSKPAKVASTGSVCVGLGYEGWNPCTCSHASLGPDALINAIACGCVTQGKSCSTQYSFIITIFHAW